MTIPVDFANLFKARAKMNPKTLYDLLGKTKQAYEKAGYNININYNSSSFLKMVEQGNR